ncbi:ABC transporter ATP-binding protein [Elioraea sp. Yellowstone]|jgi:zinc/manganese transport system ATP-binding protein|uniref:metal ABC transporter ATP-binding protein n=1 Tax=Elioraea sp. Yellowstone TaxID=2592070 RepID=UPI00114DE23A|nr:ABC transporter ATP-binding protein [Elioraea sp. Yellowstone]TQF77965.1 ABC transporter ATP-binding protein [Elioraea sp. Yellowstone]
MIAPIRLSDVTVAYRRRPAVHHLSGTFAPGSMTAIVGPNGAGKTTLLRALIGELPLDQGRIDRGGIDPRDIAYLPQQAALDRTFPLACAEVVAMGHWGRIGAFRRITGAAAARVADALAAVGLDGFARRPLATLSAGQFQRVLFARMLLQDAPVVLLDEPFTAIDARTTADLMRVVTGWHGEGRTVIAVLHDLEMVRAHFPDALLLAREAIAWGPTGTALTSANLFRARMMAEAWDEDAAICTRGESRRAA